MAGMKFTSGPAIAVTVLLVALTISPFYVLSCGPAYWLMTHKYVERETLPALYQPIHWANMRSERFRRFIWWYVELWDESMPLNSVDPFG